MLCINRFSDQRRLKNKNVAASIPSLKNVMLSLERGVETFTN